MYDDACSAELQTQRGQTGGQSVAVEWFVPAGDEIPFTQIVPEQACPR
jgi:hypothetical protein